MATILEFRRTEEAAARSGKPVEGALGEIIIFPGVRIERHKSNDAPERSSQIRRRAPRVRKKSRRA